MPEQDVRAAILRDVFGAGLGPEFDFKPYFGATLFKQGTEPVAMQRGNLDMANIGAFDVQKQIPAWSLVTTPYLFRDAAHMKKVFASDVGRELNKAMEDQMGIKVLSAPYIGTRHLNLKPKKKITTPADLAGIKLRMPGGKAGSSSARRSAPTRCRWPTPRPTPRCRPAPSTRRTTR